MIRRGASKTLGIELDVDTSTLGAIWVTVGQKGGTCLTREDPVRMPDGRTLALTLTQEETLQLIVGPAWVQVRAETLDGHVLSSDLKSTAVAGTLCERVIE